MSQWCESSWWGVKLFQVSVKQSSLTKLNSENFWKFNFLKISSCLFGPLQVRTAKPTNEPNTRNQHQTSWSKSCACLNLNYHTSLHWITLQRKWIGLSNIELNYLNYNKLHHFKLYIRSSYIWSDQDDHTENLISNKSLINCNTSS